MPGNVNVFSEATVTVGRAAAGTGVKVCAHSTTRMVSLRLRRVLGAAMISAPRSWTQLFPPVWSKCQWVLTRYLMWEAPSFCRARSGFRRETAMPASTMKAPSLLGSTPMIPPDPWSRYTPPRSGVTVMGPRAAAALSTS
ncbi:hypothetical protein ADL25_40875 [Streptomyces sp. NRRL F-5122]|nr:hypothetical protein ADL25_40875 [Streptomyces sp. NRRL F-5122]